MQSTFHTLYVSLLTPITAVIMAGPLLRFTSTMVLSAWRYGPESTLSLHRQYIVDGQGGSLANKATTFT